MDRCKCIAEIRLASTKTKQHNLYVATTRSRGNLKWLVEDQNTTEHKHESGLGAILTMDGQTENGENDVTIKRKKRSCESRRC